MTGSTGASSSSVAVFAPFEADFERRTLAKSGAPVHLAPLGWRLLELMVRRAGEVVSKDEVKRHLWPDEHATEYALSRAVRRLREALDDDARAPRYLRTIHGSGFQWIAAGIAPAITSTAPTADLPASFIGRHAHIEQLAAATATAARGRRQCVAIEGSLGAGKSTLVEEFIASGLPGWWIATGRCRESQGEQEPFAPIMEALDRLASHAPTTVVPVLRRFAPTWLAQMPWLTDEHERTDLMRAIEMSSPARMMRELTRSFDELSVLHPVALWLDDVHWADPDTVDAIAALVSRTERARLLVVTCHRADDARADNHPITRVLAERSLHGQVRRAVLEPFDRTEVRELIDSRLASLRSVERSELTSGLMHWTAGNPLFATVVLDRIHAESPESGSVTIGVDAEAFPESLSVLLDETIERLDDEARTVVEIGSLIGDDLSTIVLSEVSGLDPVVVERTIADTVAKSPVLVPANTAAPNVAGRFAHGAFRSRARARVSPVQAERLHRRIGETLEAADSPADPRTIAHHLELGGEAMRAVPHWIEAATQSRLRFAHQDAAEIYERAVATLIAADGAADPQQEILARIGLAMCHVASRTSDDAELQHNIDRLTALVEPLREHAAGFALWRATLLVNNIAGRTDRVRDMAPAMLTMADTRGRPTELVDAHHAMGEASLHAGRLVDAQRHFEEASTRLAAIRDNRPDPTEDQLLRMRDVGARVESARAGVATLRHDHDEAQRLVDASLALTIDGVNTPLVRVGNLTICAAIRWLVGDTTGAVELADHALDEADGENEGFAAIARVVRWAVRGVPPADEARAAGITMLERPTVPFPLGLIVYFRADLLAPAELLAQLDTAERQCERRSTRWADAEWRRQRARLLFAEGADRAAVEPLLHAARALAAEQDATFYLADVDADLAALDER